MTLSLYGMVSISLSIFLPDYWQMNTLVRGPLDSGEIHAFAGEFVKRRHLTQATDFVDAAGAHIVYLSVGGEAAEAKAERGVGEFVADAERLEDVGRLQGRR